MNREKTSITVKVLDLSSCVEKVKVHFSSVINKPKCVKIIDVFFRGKIALVGTPKGTYVINNNGTGPLDPIVPGKPYFLGPIDILFFNENSLEHFIRHFGPISYPLSKLQELKVIEVMDLSDFILTGEKRDKFYKIWKSVLEPFTLPAS